MNELSSPSAPSGPDRDLGPLAVESALRSWNIEGEIASELPGGASTRRFFRVPYRGASAIAMYIPLPSQEIAKARQSRGGGPFVEVADLLRSAGVPVPLVFERSDEHHVLLVEDLGDDTLANYLLTNEDARLDLYKTAVIELATAQRQLENLPEDSVVRGRAFDEDLLRWEVDHFRTWALEARGVQLSSTDADIFDRSAAYLASTIAGWSRGFVHRDYQSRNLMVSEQSGGRALTWIDFQDAMMGPRAYDLVALLTDSYQTFTREFIEARLDDFCAARGIESERERLGFEFDFITVQRKLKDAGRFVFIERVNKNDSFLPFVDGTIEKARGALSRVRDEGPLRELEELLGRIL